MDQPPISPPAGSRLLRYVGDTAQFTLGGGSTNFAPDQGWQARLRTDLGRAALLRQEIIRSHFHHVPLAGASWHDVPMRWENDRWTATIPLTEVGYFRAKPYALNALGRQFWAGGSDLGITVHPDSYRTANTIYCAFPRMFGPGKTAAKTKDDHLEQRLQLLDQNGYTVIPPSGKLRDLTRELPHIFDTLGCRILHLLPVTPTPTTYARFGRFGSPYACQELTGVDPALVEFDKQTTGIDQFCELADGVHQRGGRLFLDIVINHTGWGAPLWENHPEWYLRKPDGEFISPGAWGNIWEDLVELEHTHPELWEYLSEVFLTWCRRGVDGFRCDAGYKVPTVAWQYIIARVRQEFPDTIFLLEGLGGSWAATETLLTEGGMQWAYSELFQNYTGAEVAGYLENSPQARNVGVMVHYSETHDNDRLAARGRAWSLLRNRLCALTSVSGGFGFTCGVEWLAAEQVNVHSSRGLNWGNSDNLVPELARLNHLLAHHPAFFDGAKLTRLSALDSPVYALLREPATGRDSLLVLVNTDPERAQTFHLSEAHFRALGDLRHELLGQPRPNTQPNHLGQIALELAPAACFCLAAHDLPENPAGDTYRRTRAQTAWGLTALSRFWPIENVAVFDGAVLAEFVDTRPAQFLAAIQQVDRDLARQDWAEALVRLLDKNHFPQVVTWRLADRRRIVPVPPHHWLLIHDDIPFRAHLQLGDKTRPVNVESIAVRDGHVACFPPREHAADAELHLERFAATSLADRRLTARVRYLTLPPDLDAPVFSAKKIATSPLEAPLVLLTNGRGGMARMAVNLGAVKSKYDCVLAANLHPAVPVDRHVFVKRARVWVNADGFITALNLENLVRFEPGPPAHWRFVANAGNGRSAEIHLEADLAEDQNLVVLRFSRPAAAPSLGRDLPDECRVTLTVRLDIEDRGFHSETKHNDGSHHHFTTHSHALRERPGFAFTPAPDRQFRAWSTAGAYHHEAEWSHNLPHIIEASRGQEGAGDAFSPGWFEIPLAKGADACLAINAEAEAHDPAPAQLHALLAQRRTANAAAIQRAQLPESDHFGRQLALATHAFVVRRGAGKTVIAGYPWFLDWGRDSLICARGLLAAGMFDEVRQLLQVFGRFAENGTLPNTIHGEDATNRDTTDAPLWFGVVCEEAAAAFTARPSSPSGQSGPPGPPGPHTPSAFYATPVDDRDRTLADVLREIAEGYLRGTPNGIRVDDESALVWSPSHFTWMDTNYPAGTPRQGYPVEIQVLWIRLLRQLETIASAREKTKWATLANRAQASFERHFWLEDRGYLADLLIAAPGQRAAAATVDTALRSNGLLAVAFGFLTGERARRCVAAALQHLVVPGALRTLAPLPVEPPLPIHGPHGQLLNNPAEPYWPRYDGDEDTRRKPAYHNGTAWTWTFPIFCEALARAWDFSPTATAAARAYLGSMDRLLKTGCLGHLPEIVDGDAPHTQRGCDAQAWGATEALRVWKLLATPSP